MTKIAAFTLVLLLAASAGASAQTIYRCGSEYTRVPCPDGKAIDPDNRASSTKQVAEARQAAERERRLGNDMERDRLRREAALRPARAGSLSAPKPPEHAASAPAAKPKKKPRTRSRTIDEKNDFVATVPRKGKGTGH